MRSKVVKRRKNNKLYILILLILTISVGYALLSSALNITGFAGIKKNTYDIHWDENSIVESQGIVQPNTGAYVTDTEKKNISFDVNLELPGDFYEFTVDAKNYGTINGKIENINLKFLDPDTNEIIEPDDLPDYLIYSIEYADGTPISSNQIIESGESIKYKFRMEFDSEATALPEIVCPTGEDSCVKPLPKPTVEIDVKQAKSVHTVTFDPTGGTTAQERKKIESGNKIGEMPGASYDNKPFLGWYTEEIGGTEITEDFEPTENITVYAHWPVGTFAQFDTGKNVNVKMKELAGDTLPATNPWYCNDTNITSIQKSSTEPAASIKTPEHIVSTLNSEEPIYAWFDNGTIYYWSAANNIYLNEDASYMFNAIKAATSIDTTGYSTIQTKNMSYMFASVSASTLDFSHYETQNVTDMSYMFSGVSTPTLDLTAFDTSKVTTMSYMFVTNSSTTLNTSRFRTENVTDMSGMFLGTSVASIDVSNFDSKKVTNMSNMFNGSQATTITFGNFDTSSVTNMSTMFASAKVKSLDMSGFDVSNVTNFGSFLAGTSSLEYVSISGWKFNSSITSLGTFFGMGLTKLEYADLSNVDASHVQSLSTLFSGDSSLVGVNFEGFETGSLTNISAMFGGCTSLKTLDLSMFDTSTVTNMQNVVSSCISLETLNMSGWDFTAYNPNGYLMSKLSNDSLNSIKNIILDDAILPQYGSGMFNGLTTLEHVGFEDVDTTHVTTMTNMFNNCNKLKSLDLSDFDTSSVTDMSVMFNNADSLKVLALESFDTHNVTDMTAMFYSMDNIRTITVSDDFVVDQLTSSSGMFGDDYKLVGGNGTAYDSAHIDKVYAHYDYGDVNPGYFNRRDAEFYKIRFDANGGSSVDSPILVLKGEAIGNLPLTTKTDYGFGGWYSPARELGGIKITNSFVPESDMTLTAAWDLVEAKFDVGTTVNTKFKELAGDTLNYTWNAPYASSSTNVTAIKRSETPPEDGITTDIVSVEGSTPIYAWFDNGIIYWYCETSRVYLNENASYMFSYFDNVTEIDTSFDTSLTTSMYYMFGSDPSLLSIDVSNFNTSNVTNLSYMFAYSNSLKKLDLSNFNTSNVTNMRAVVSSESVEEIDVSNWDFSNYTGDCLGDHIHTAGTNSLKKIKFDNAILPTNCRRLVAYNYNVEEISLRNADASNVTSMEHMFASNSKLKKVDLTNLNTSKVTTMENMFFKDGKLESVDLSSFDTHNVTNMVGMFQACNSLKRLDLSMLNTSKVTNMKYIAGYCENLEELNISNFSFDNYDFTINDHYIYNLYYSDPKLKSLKADNIVFKPEMRQVFYGLENVEEISLKEVDTSNATTMQGLFEDCRKLRILDLSSFDTHNVTNMTDMFSNCNLLTTVYVSNNFIVDQVTSSNNMFASDYAIVGGEGTAYDPSTTDKTFAVPDSIVTPGYFTLKDKWVLVNRQDYQNPGEHLLDQKWSYYDNGVRIENGFYLLNDLYGIEQKYFFINGIAHMGWLNFEGNYYYLSTEDDDNNGFVNLNAYRSVTKTIDGVNYTFDSDGKCTNYSGTDFHTIIFNPNGGIPSQGMMNVNNNSAIGTLPTVTRFGRTFLGWYTGLTDGVLVDDSYVPTSNMVVYARWG